MSTSKRSIPFSFSIRSMRAGDLKEVLILWRNSKGVGLRPDDKPFYLAKYLRRNPGLSLVAVSQSKIVGTLLGGHDGRRGMLAHLAVAESFRKKGIGRRLVNECLQKLEKVGIPRSLVTVFHSNRAGLLFWRRMGWIQRKDLAIFASRFKIPGKRSK